MNRISHWLIALTLFQAIAVAGFTFNTSVPTQCGDFTVQWYVYPY
jgi:hypothetical protein